jgi:hypothetical protein
MVDGIGIEGLGDILQTQKVQRVGGADTGDMPRRMVGALKDAAEISPVGQMMHSFGQMDDATRAEFKEFMKNMRQEFGSGNYDAESIAGSASDGLTAFAENQGIDLMGAVENLANFAQVHLPLRGGLKGNPDRMAEKLISRLDADGDGVLDSIEIEIPQPLFVNLDSNENGVLDKDELKALGEMRPKGKKAGKGSKKDQSTTEQVTGRFDTTGDGVADTEEVTTYNANGEVQSVETRAAGSGGGMPVI